MEFISIGQERVATARQKSYLIVSLFISAGICFGFLQVLPQNTEDSDSKINYLHYGIMRIFMSVVVLLLEVFMIWIIRKKNRFHRNQQVFWPLLCRHCAQVVGLSGDSMAKRNRHEHVSSNHLTSVYQELTTSDQQQVLCNDKSTYPHTVPSSDSMLVQTFSRGNARQPDNGLCKGANIDNLPRLSSWPPAKQFESDLDLKRSIDYLQGLGSSGSSHSSKEVEGYSHNRARTDSARTVRKDNYEGRSPKRGQLYMYRKPHMSLLKTFSVFGFISALNLPVELLGVLVFLCRYAGRDKQIAIVGQLMQDISFLTITIFGMVFFAYYYGAVFVEEPIFSYALGIGTVGSIYLVTGKMLYPVGNAAGNKVNNPGYLYRINGTFGDFLLWHEAILTPFYVEMGIIAAGMMWQIWGSVYPSSCFRIQEHGGHIEGSKDLNIRPFWITSKDWNNQNKRARWWTWMTPHSTDSQTLLKDNIFSNEYKSVCLKTVICCAFLCSLYFSLSLFLSLGKTPSLSSSSEIYLQWSLEIAFTLPFLAVCRFQTVLSNSSMFYLVKRNVAIPNGLLESHDKVLLLSSVGIFTLSFFRFFAALGILFNSTLTADGEVLALACFGLVYSVFKVVSIYIITFLLIVVQRQKLSKKAEIKWTLITLICMTFLNATLWFRESLEINPWTNLKRQYGEVVGKLIGSFLEPLCDLYGLHAAMVSYETYKELSSSASATDETNIHRESGD